MSIHPSVFRQSFTLKPNGHEHYIFRRTMLHNRVALGQRCQRAHAKSGAEVHYCGKDAAASVRAGYPVNGKVRSVIEPAGTFYVRISGIRVRKQREYAADLSAAAQYVVPAGFKIRVYQRLGRSSIPPLVRIAALRHPSASGSVDLHYPVLIGLFGVSDGV